MLGRFGRSVRRGNSKRIKDLAEIARMVEAHPDLWRALTNELKEHIEAPPHP